MRQTILELRLMLGQTIIWWGIRLCPKSRFQSAMLAVFAQLIRRDADRVADEMNVRN